MMQDTKPAQGANFDTPPDEWMAGPEISNDGGFESGVADGEEEDDHDPAIMDLPDIEGFEASGPKYWPDNDEDSPFYRHLLENGASPANKQFLFHKGALDLYCAANRFAFKGKNDVIVFGMRGARLLDQEYHENVESLPLEIARPDHYNFRCVIGYYFRSTGTFSAYTASTVPWHGYITAGKKTNVLALGCYIYARGPHLRQGPVIPAFRVPDERSVLTVLRRGTSKFFDFRGSWDTNGDIWDNIHCAYGDKKFSSQGCQTVKGGKDSGLWGRFQSEIKKLGDGRVDYMLLTGDEASIAAIHADEGKSLADPQTHQRLSRLRIGSEGEEVRRLLELLKLKSSTYFGPHVMAALIKAQKEKGLPADGIFSPALEAHFGSVFVAAGSPVVVDLQPKPPEPKLPGGGQPTQPDAPAGGGGTPPLPPGGGQPLPKPDVPLADTGGGTTGGKRTDATALLTRDNLVRIAPRPPNSKVNTWEKYITALASDEAAQVLASYDIADSPQRLAFLIANVIGETGHLTVIRESGSYKKETILKHFGVGKSAAKVTEQEAAQIAALPVENDVRARALFNRIYGISGPPDARKKAKELGNSEPDDGYRYRGGGMFQTTGRFNYRDMGQKIGIGSQLEDNPDLIENPIVSLKAACAEWKKVKLNDYADAGDFVACCKGINCGSPKSSRKLIGGKHRFDALQKVCEVFKLQRPTRQAGLESTGADDEETMQCGDFGPPLVEFQRRLNDLGYDAGKPDGVFSEQTRDAVLVFQATNGLPYTGRTDRATRDALQQPAAAVHWRKDGRQQLDGGVHPSLAPVQKRLNELGYDAGPEDGRSREQLRGALLSFQSSSDLPLTGVADEATRTALADEEAASHWSIDEFPEDDSAADGFESGIGTGGGGGFESGTRQLQPAIPPEMVVTDKDLPGAKLLETYRGTRLFALVDGRIYLEGSVALSTVELARATLDLMATR